MTLKATDGLSALIVVLSGCTASIPNGIIACDLDSKCPEGFVCRNEAPGKSERPYFCFNSGESANPTTGGAGGGGSAGLQPSPGANASSTDTTSTDRSDAGSRNDADGGDAETDQLTPGDPTTPIILGTQCTGSTTLTFDFDRDNGNGPFEQAWGDYEPTISHSTDEGSPTSGALRLESSFEEDNASSQVSGDVPLGSYDCMSARIKVDPNTFDLSRMGAQWVLSVLDKNNCTARGLDTEEKGWPSGLSKSGKWYELHMRIPTMKPRTNSKCTTVDFSRIYAVQVGLSNGKNRGRVVFYVDHIRLYNK